MGTLRKTKSGEGSSHLPDGWREVKLGDVGKITTGKTPSEKYPADWGDKMLFVTPSDYKNYGKFAYSTDRKLSDEGINRLRNKILSPKSVMVTCIGYMGKVAINKFQAVTNQQINSITPYPRVVDSDFLYYFLASIYNLLQKRYGTAGTAVPIINKGDFEQIDTFLPPLHEQKSIAEVLSSLDDKIDLLHRQNKTLEDMAQTIFRQWFVEEADENWEIKKISAEFDLTMGQSPPGSSYNESQQGTPMFQGNADFGFRFPKNRIYTIEPTRLAEKFDTLISVRAPVGEQNMAKEKCCIGRGVAAFRYKADKSFYTYTYFKMMSLMNRVKQYNQEGTVFGSISKSDFDNFSITIPPITLIKKFQNTAKPLDDKIISNQSQIHTLENLRDTLLPKLMRGAVKIKDVSHG